MADDMNLDLSVPEPGKSKSTRNSGLVLLLLFAVLIVAGANLVLLLRRQSPEKLSTEPTSALSSESAKDLALKLEQQGLRSEAIAAWREFLHIADYKNESRAKIWYRIGKLHQENRNYEAALHAYYRSESLFKVGDIKQDMNQRVQECLESAGRNGALEAELASRVGIGEQKKTSEVLAEIGTRKITRQELDRRIDDILNRQLKMMAGRMSPEQRKQQKEAIRKQLSSDRQKSQILNQLILEEILYRKAREDKLIDKPEIRALLDDTTRQILASQVVQRELANQINITQTDLETFYKANQDRYKEAAKAKISHILVAKEDEAKAAINSLKSNQKFEELAKSLSLDNDTKDKGGELPGEVRAGGYIPGLGSSPELSKAIFATDAGKVIDKPFKTDTGWHVVKVRERIPERPKALSEVQDQVYRDLRSKKEQEVREQLLNRLRDKYDVVVHMSKIKPDDKQKK